MESVCAACKEASLALTSADDCTFSSCASNCPSLYVIALLHVQVGDLAKGICADIHVCLRLDFTGGADDGSQILPLRLSGLHRDHVFTALMNGERDDDYQ